MSAAQILARTAALMAVVLLGHGAASVAPTDGGANIGIGLAAFAVCAAVALLLGVRDGRRGRLGALVRGWVVIAVLLGAAASASISAVEALRGNGFSMTVLVSDLTGSAPFLAVLVATPALLGIAVSASRRAVPER